MQQENSYQIIPVNAIMVIISHQVVLRYKCSKKSLKCLLML